MTTRLNPENVFRVRRVQPTRLEGFVDSAFAFAVTLLVISVGRMPASVPDVLQALRGLPAFAASFLLLARLWKAHRDWSRHYDIEDITAIRLSLLLVLIVLAFVYPLRFLFALLFVWLSHGYLTDQPIQVNSILEYREAFEIYGIAFAAIAAVFFLLYRHALRCADEIGLDANERVATRMTRAIWISYGAVALASALAAALLPFDVHQQWLFAVPGSMYMLMGAVVVPVRRYYAARITRDP